MHPLIREFQKDQLKKVPALRPGYTVSVHQKIKEGGKERIQIFEGLVIAIGKGVGPLKSFTVRKVVEGIGVEKVFPLHSPHIAKIVVKREGSVRRAKLYYMRGRFGKSARLREGFVTEEAVEEEVKEVAPVKAEEKIEKAAEPTVTSATPEVAAQ